MSKEELKKYLIKINKLTLEINKLKKELDECKNEAMNIFSLSPSYKDKKYQIQGNFISCQNKKIISGLSQKLIKESLIEYITIKKININYQDLLNYILNKRSVNYKDSIVIKMANEENNNDEENEN
jgi:hypothetical protein